MSTRLRVRFLFVLLLGFALGFFGCATTPPNPPPKPELLFSDSIERIEVRDLASSLVLQKQNANWNVEKWNETTPDYRAASANKIVHLLDLVRSAAERASFLKIIPTPPPGTYRSYELVFTYADQTTDRWIFDRSSPGGRRGKTWIYSTKTQGLYEIPSALGSFLQATGPKAFRDQRVSVLAEDDLEELKTSGKCNALWVYRDGDRWVWKKGKKRSQETTITNLERLLEGASELLTSPVAVRDSQGCLVELIGRENKKDTFELFKMSKGPREEWIARKKTDEAEVFFRLPTSAPLLLQ